MPEPRLKGTVMQQDTVEEKKAQGKLAACIIYFHALFTASLYSNLSVLLYKMWVNIIR